MKPPMLLTGWCGTGFAEIASYTLPLMERYAQKHGMEFLCVNLHNDEVPPSWCKVARLIDCLERGYETCVWLDVDVVVYDSSASILDDVPETAWQGLVEHETECGLVPNCGVWVVRSQMRPVLEDAWASRGECLHHPWWEQAAILKRMGYGPDVMRMHSSVERGEPTPLFDKTHFLHPKWNHHPHDRRRVDNVAFIHVTQYLYRAKACKEYADHAT